MNHRSRRPAITMEISNEMILKYQRCETTPEEERLLLDYLDESEAHRRRLDRENFLFCAGILNQKRKARRFRLAGWLSAAAAAVLLCGTLLWLSTRRTPALEDAVAEVVVEASEGSRTRVGLPDGSVVWLNSGSKLTYPESFNRSVTLEGEGYFDVAHCPEAPFIVSVADVRVCVLGTVFNVHAYPGEGRVETTLATGSVSLDDAAGNKLFLLHPGQQVSCRTDGSDLEVHTVDAWTMLLDTYGVVTIPDVSLTDLCDILHQVYGIAVKARSDDGTPVTFSFIKDAPIEEVIARLEALSGKKINIEKGIRP